MASDEAIARAAEHLRRRGWAVIENVLSPVECASLVDEGWRWLESLGTGLKRDQPETWKASAWPPNIHGIVQQSEVGHQSFVWRVRKHPDVRRVFESFYGTNALLSSFDGVSIMRPSQGRGATGKPWLVRVLRNNFLRL